MKSQIYKCDPKKNSRCLKTSCQKECFWTTEKQYSIDNKPYVYDDLTQNFIPYNGGN